MVHLPSAEHEEVALGAGGNNKDRDHSCTYLPDCFGKPDSHVVAVKCMSVITLTSDVICVLKFCKMLSVTF